jgi:RNA polymerase sigma-70 factor (ECF subfamily)
MLEWAARLRRQEVVVRGGPQQAIAEAYRANLASVYRFIYRRVGNRETAEDLTEEVFAKAIQGLQAERAPQAVQSWLYATARTTIVDYWRAQIGTTVDIAEFENILSDSDGDDEQWETQTARRVTALLDALPPRERRVLTLRFLRGYTLAEAARELGTSAGNVKVLQHRALKRAATLEAMARGKDRHERG